MKCKSLFSEKKEQKKKQKKTLVSSATTVNGALRVVSLHVYLKILHADK